MLLILVFVLDDYFMVATCTMYSNTMLQVFFCCTKLMCNVIICKFSYIHVLRDKLFSIFQ